MSIEFNDDDFSSMQKAMEEEQKKSTFQSMYWNPQGEGAFPIRIISPLKQFGEKLFYQKRRIHYIGGKPILCLNQTLKDKNGETHEAEDCPICAKVKQLYRMYDKDTEETKIASSINAKDRFVARVVVRNKKTEDGQDDEAKPEFWEFGKKLYEYFFNQIQLKEAGNFLSLKDGRDFNLVKKGTGRNTDYSASCLSMKTSPVFTDVEKLKKLMEHLPDMEYSKLVEFKSREEVERILNEFFMQDSAPTVTVTKPVEPDPLDPLAAAPTTSFNPLASEKEEKPADDIDALLSMI